MNLRLRQSKLCLGDRLDVSFMRIGKNYYLENKLQKENQHTNENTLVLYIENQGYLKCKHKTNINLDGLSETR